MRYAMLLSSTVALVSCTPELVSGTTTTTTGGGPTGTFVAPENSWPAGTPPADLQGQGFEEGQVVLDGVFFDQFGDDVKLWQLYGQLWVLDISTIWCGPCREIAQHVQEVQDTYVDQGFFMVTVLTENLYIEPPDLDDIVEWTEFAEIVDAPVLADVEGYGYQLVPDGTFPRLLLIDRDLTVIEEDIEPVTSREVLEALIQEHL